MHAQAQPRQRPLKRSTIGTIIIRIGSWGPLKYNYMGTMWDIITNYSTHILSEVGGLGVKGLGVRVEGLRFMV